MQSNIEKFLTAIRRYCIDNSSLWKEKYYEIASSGKNRSGFDYTDESLYSARSCTGIRRGFSWLKAENLSNNLLAVALEMIVDAGEAEAIALARAKKTVC